MKRIRTLEELNDLKFTAFFLASKDAVTKMFPNGIYLSLAVTKVDRQKEGFVLVPYNGKMIYKKDVKFKDGLLNIPGRGYWELNLLEKRG